MKILIVVATRAELNLFIQHYNLPEGDFLSGKNFDVLITGVGMVATAFSLGAHLALQNYGGILNVGITGSFDYKLELGSLVNIKEDIFAELGAENGSEFLTIVDLGFGENHYYAQPFVELDFPQVSAITVNRVSGSEHSIATIIKRLNPSTESMEGAAVFYACQQKKLPCMQVRSISNYVEIRNKDNWKIGLAIKNLNEWLIGFIGDMN